MNWLSLDVPKWLSDAADEPQECRKQWWDNPRLVQALPTGRTFDAVSVTYRLGIEALSLLLMGSSTALCSPAVVDFGSWRVAFLVPVGSSEVFRSALGDVDTSGRVLHRYTGAGGFVVLPGPHAMAGERYAWMKVPPESLEELGSAVDDLVAHLVAARRIVASAQSFGGVQEGGDSDA